MDPLELLRHASAALERIRVTYFVTGSIASIAYGETRFTNDIDVVIDLPQSEIDAFCAEFPTVDYYWSRPAIEQAVREKRQFNVIHPASGLKIDFMLTAATPYETERRRRIRHLALLPDRTVACSSPEDVILKKMTFYQLGGSDKHLRDIAGILDLQREQLDRAYIEKWAAVLQVSDLWKEIQTRHEAQ